MSNSPDWLSANDTRMRLIRAGIGESDLLRIVAWACRSNRVFSTGFPRIHSDENHSQLIERRNLNTLRIWQVLERLDSSFPLELPDRRKAIRPIIDWKTGHFSFSITKADGRRTEEHWEAVHFDRISVESLMDQWQTRSQVNELQDIEIDVWIGTECQTENSKDAWRAFKGAFGNRSGKRDPTFLAAWHRVKGKRGRGRPVRSEQRDL